MKTVVPAPWVCTIPEYIPGRSKEEIARTYGVANPIKLASNENPLGPSPMALEAISAAQGLSHLYPDPDSRDLREAAGSFFGCSAEDIIAGNGSDEIIDIVCRAYLRPGDEVIIPACTFSYYRIAALVCGATVKSSPMDRHLIDVKGIQDAIGGSTRIIFVANPNNPTGTLLDSERIGSLLSHVPEHVLLVIDEAYAAFVREKGFSGASRLIHDHPNLITVHTLSKSHGLAGLRVGFGIASKALRDDLMRIKPPFNVNILAQKAGTAALRDHDFLNKTLATTWKGMDMLYAAFGRLGLEYTTSHTNFVLVRIGTRAREVYESLLKRGIITRYMANTGLDEHIRVSVGLPDENQAFVSALEEAL